ncbi:sugar porter family MFS transporter [Kutzneria sp. CA-103260]|uniref:sugar porter family MFS transporter n=1 Tax=Kutzneria sp. CA-103260 TaxID=2802641 RepID=UPI001BADF148|nr:sugar porter family MFS transporter [Kutzneria sp. CA-103260]QUQ64503.1 MFS transporter arabinose transport protein [Kutzneria sp. CA-103260]
MSRAATLVAVAGGAIGVIFGYDIGSVSGVIPGIQHDFRADDLLASTVNTVVVLGQVVGAVLAGKLSDALGRRRTVTAVSVGYTLLAVAQAVAPTIVALDVVRALLGVTVGVSMVAAPLFVAETAQARQRGRLVALYQVAVVGGLFLAYLTDYFLAVGDNWRLMLGLPAVPAFAVLCVVLALPESPRWLVLMGRTDEARQVLADIEPGVDAASTITAITADAARERGGRLRHLFLPSQRRATVFIVCLGVFAQITGINAITYYSPAIFTHLGFSSADASFGLATANQFCAVLATVAGLAVIDRLGRRVTLLTGLALMAVAATGLAVATGVASSSAWFGFAMVVLFTGAFNGGFGSVIWVYPSEVFSVRLRALGASVMLASALIANSVVAELFLWAVSRLGGSFVFGFFAATTVLAIIFIVWLAPETSGRALEEAGLAEQPKC